MFPVFMPAIYSCANTFMYPDFIFRPKNISINFWFKKRVSCFKNMIHDDRPIPNVMCFDAANTFLMSKTFNPVGGEDKLFGMSCKVFNRDIFSTIFGNYMSMYFA